MASHFRFFLYATAVVVAMLGLAALVGCDKAPTRQGHGEAIQGLYSHLDCDSQPGTQPWYEYTLVTNSLGETSYLIYFMGCR